MKTNKEKELGQFFEQFKELSTYYKIEQVHRLIETPEAMARLRKGGKYKPLKFIIMSGIILTAIGAALLLTQPKSIETELNEPTPLTITKQQTVVNPENNLSESTILFSNSEESVDSLMDGEKMIVELSAKELEKLGFLIDETGVYYFNEFNNEIAAYHMRDENGNGENTKVINFRNRHNKKEASSHSFYPITLSNRLTLSKGNNFSEDEFMQMNDTLIPIHLNFYALGFPRADDKVLWFNSNTDIFNHLPKRYRWMQDHYTHIKTLKSTNPNIIYVDYQPDNIIEEINCIQLDQEELEKIGFKFSNDNVSIIIYKEEFPDDTLNLKAENLTFYERKLYRIYDTPPQLTMNLAFSKGTSAMNIKYSERDELKVLPIFYITNLQGVQMAQWSKQTDKFNKYQYDYFMNKLDYLIPILLKQTDYPNILSEDKVYWFEPTPELIDLLPEDIGEQIEYEYNIITGSTDNIDPKRDQCVYFEACKSTLMLNDLKLYPNPAKHHATLQFNYHESIAGSIELIDLKGSNLKTLVPYTQFINGLNSYKLDLTGIQPGMYLVSVQSSVGFKTVRLIVLE